MAANDLYLSVQWLGLFANWIKLLLKVSATFNCTMKFLVKDCDPATGEPDEDGYRDEYVVSVLGDQTICILNVIMFLLDSLFLVPVMGHNFICNSITTIQLFTWTVGRCGADHSRPHTEGHQAKLFSLLGRNWRSMWTGGHLRTFQHEDSRGWVIIN